MTITSRPLLLALVVLVSFCTQAAAQQENAVVRIDSVFGGKHRTGTGFVVARDGDTVYVVTASHVVEGDPKPTVTFFGNRAAQIEAHIEGLEGGNAQGLAALSVTGHLPPNIGILELADSLPAPRSNITLIGFPEVAQTPWAVTGGMISGRNGPFLTVSGTFDEGNSGSPVIVDGKVAGVLTDAAGKFGYAVPAPTVSIALSGWGVDIRRPSPPPAVAMVNGVMWTAADNGSDVSFAGAKAHCAANETGGYGDWVLPTVEQLQGLYDPSSSYVPPSGLSGPVHIKPPIRLTSYSIWSSEVLARFDIAGDITATGFSFGSGTRFDNSVDGSMHALCVRK